MSLDREAVSFSNYNMINVAGKAASMRRALAKGSIILEPEAFTKLMARELPKGDPFPLAEAAAVMAAKRTADIVPLCHPLRLDGVKVWFQDEPDQKKVTVFCEVYARERTGVEMEALAGVNAALLTIYDLSKQLTKHSYFSDIMLLEKEGGKSGYWTRDKQSKEPEYDDPILVNLRASVITVSDSSASGKRVDLSGPCLKDLAEAKGASVVHTKVVPDSKEEIEEALKEAISIEAQIIFTSGGTGLGPRDMTPEVVEGFCDRMVPGIGEMLRDAGQSFTPYSILSRLNAGIKDKTLIIAFPGSPKAVKQNFDLLLGVLPHALKMLGGEGH